MLIYCIFNKQQEQVLGELYWYVNQTPPPIDASEVSETLAYLKACNMLFEQGFLSHNHIMSMDCDTIKNIDQGYKYFSGWLSSILDKGMDTHTHARMHTHYTTNTHINICSSFILQIQITHILHQHRNHFCHGKVSNRDTFCIVKYLSFQHGISYVLTCMDLRLCVSGS